MRRRRKYLDRRQSDDHARWLVSYSDFITLLFAFFVVMYAISSLNEGKYRAVSEALLSAFRSAQLAPPVRGLRRSGGKVEPALARRAPPNPPRILAAVAPTVPPVAARQRLRRERAMRAVARDILAVLGPVARTGQVRIMQSKRGVAVEINAKVLFPPAQARLEGPSARLLARVGEVLAKLRYDIEVEGFSDDVPISTPRFPSNWELSAARASSVARVFISGGVAARRLSVVGYGPNRPIASNATAAGRARNRRVTVMILAKAPDHPVEIPVNGPAGRAAR